MNEINLSYSDFYNLPIVKTLSLNRSMHYKKLLTYMYLSNFLIVTLFAYISDKFSHGYSSLLYTYLINFLIVHISLLTYLSNVHLNLHSCSESSERTNRALIGFIKKTFSNKT